MRTSRVPCWWQRLAAGGAKLDRLELKRAEIDFGGVVLRRVRVLEKHVVLAGQTFEIPATHRHENPVQLLVPRVTEPRELQAAAQTSVQRVKGSARNRHKVT